MNEIYTHTHTQSAVVVWRWHYKCSSAELVIELFHLITTITHRGLSVGIYGKPWTLWYHKLYKIVNCTRWHYFSLCLCYHPCEINNQCMIVTNEDPTSAFIRTYHHQLQADIASQYNAYTFSVWSLPNLHVSTTVRMYLVIILHG